MAVKVFEIITINEDVINGKIIQKGTLIKIVVVLDLLNDLGIFK